MNEYIVATFCFTLATYPSRGHMTRTPPLSRTRTAPLYGTLRMALQAQHAAKFDEAERR